MSKIVAFYRDIAQVVIGELVEDTEIHLKVRNPAFLGASANETGRINLNFIQCDMLSIEGVPVSYRNISKPFDNVMQFKKDDLLVVDLPLQESVMQHYVNHINGKRPIPAPSQEETKNSTDEIHKLFDH